MLAWPRWCKRLLAVLVDALLAAATLWLAFDLRFGLVSNPSEWHEPIWVYALPILIALPIFVSQGLYRMIFRYGGGRMVQSIGLACLLHAVIFAAIVIGGNFDNVPRSVGLMQPALFFIAVLATRAGVASWLGQSYRARIGKQDKKIAMIFGAGRAGQQAAAGFALGGEVEIVGFVDDNPQLQGYRVAGLMVYSRKALPALLKKTRVQEVFLAIAALGRAEKQSILEFLGQLGVRVRILPGLADLASGKLSVSEFRDVAVDDLLGRELVAPNARLLSLDIQAKVVAVTGAGGSIGSELCRQILQQKPKCLLLVEREEFALYSIHQELEKMAATWPAQARPELVPLLASVQNKKRIHDIFHGWRPHTVYHAAAYKHVPMVEFNCAAGIENNVLGTWYAAQAARDAGVKDFVLISTDKAVRPTNVMGASKRVAEMVLQALQADAAAGGTRFSMVRFGNVLGSSGSVIPLFRRQIQNGEAITLTHRDVTRYFMTIPEAAQLVIQAAAMADGGEVFVLDMGESVRIYDLARRLIELSGLRVKDEAAPDGDIEIKITGLRPGEKLYEELLIGEDPKPTTHPRIMMAHENFLPWAQLLPQLEALRLQAKANQVQALYQSLAALVSGYHPNPNIVDLQHSAFESMADAEDEGIVA